MRFSGRCSASAFVFIILFMCSATPFMASGQEWIPSWFASPPEGPWVSVFAKNEKQAKKDGALIMATYRNSIVWGEFQSFFDTSIDDQQWTNADYYYYVDPAAVESLAETLKVADSMVVSVFPSLKLYLLAEGDEAKVSATRVATGATPRPEWTGLSGFEKEGRIYGVGRCDIVGGWPGVWTKAEERAVFGLLTHTSIRIGSISMVTSEKGAESMSDMQLIKLSYKMEGLTVVERWVDVENNQAFVLVSAPISGIRRRQ